MEDAESIFSAYASDVEVTRYLSWPRHNSLEDTRQFIRFSDAEWAQYPAGPYLIFAKGSSSLLGGTGFGFETPYRASTGYVLARNAWGKGYASEAVDVLTGLCPALGLARLYALCHPAHVRSIRVLEKSRFEYEGVLKRYCTFPNLEDANPLDALCYARVFPSARL
jgi:[ribosomal protein S5]-alanine N-acetyltransferase